MVLGLTPPGYMISPRSGGSEAQRHRPDQRKRDEGFGGTRPSFRHPTSRAPAGPRPEAGGSRPGLRPYDRIPPEGGTPARYELSTITPGEPIPAPIQPGDAPRPIRLWCLRRPANGGHPPRGSARTGSTRPRHKCHPPGDAR